MVLVFRHVAIEGPGTFESFLRDSDYDYYIIDADSYEGLNQKAEAFLEVVSEIEGLIVLGGSMNVYQDSDYPFLPKEVELLKRAVKEKVPVLGICLGAQLLARATGAKVSKAAKEEIGWYKVCLTGEAKTDPLFKDMDNSFDVFQWHEDSFEIPQTGVLLAVGQDCRNQAFRVGDCAWGLQFHPEMNSSMLKLWLEHYPAKINRNKIMVDYFGKQQNYHVQARMLYWNFSRVMGQRSRVGA